jgi:hypothetical protein
MRGISAHCALRKGGEVAEAKAVVLARGWLATEEVMRELGKARRTIQELAQQGKLHWKMSVREGMRPERVYNARDVEDLKAETQPKPLPRLERPKALPSAGGWDVPVMVELAIATKKLAESIAAPRPLPLSEKLWLSLDEAVEYSGLARADLERLCQMADEGRGQVLAEAVALERSGLPRHALIARKSGGWKILRRSLEAFEG